MKTNVHIKRTMIGSLLMILLCCILSFQSKAQCQAGFTMTVNSNTVTFTNTSSGAGQPTYSWNFGDGNFGWQTNPVHTYTANGVYPICLLMYDSLNWGCQSTYCDSIFISNAPNPPCSAYFTYSTDSLNQNGVQFYDQSANNPVSWSWSFSGGTPATSTQQNPLVTYSTPGTYIACLSIVDAFGDTCSYCDSIYYYPCNLSAGFTVNTSNDPQVTFTNTTTGGYIPIYYWNFGDGNTAWTKDATHTYQFAGTYVACMSVYDSINFCNDTYCDTIVITNAPNQPCTALFAAYPDSMPNQPNPIYFVDMSTGGSNPIISWFWNFGDGSTSTVQNPNHQYAQPGNYWVCLTVTTASSTCSTCDSVQYKLNGAGVQELNTVSYLENYPNPFSGITTIGYTLEKNSAVRISIYDYIGSKVEELENSDKSAGPHQLEWNAENLPAGIYHLEISTGTNSISKKLVLIK